jgi:hypothetical protein
MNIEAVERFTKAALEFAAGLRNEALEAALEALNAERRAEPFDPAPAEERNCVQNLEGRSCAVVRSAEAHGVEGRARSFISLTVLYDGEMQGQRFAMTREQAKNLARDLAQSAGQLLGDDSLP